MAIAVALIAVTAVVGVCYCAAVYVLFKSL